MCPEAPPPSVATPIASLARTHLGNTVARSPQLPSVTPTLGTPTPGTTCGESRGTLLSPAPSPDCPRDPSPRRGGRAALSTPSPCGGSNGRGSRRVSPPRCPLPTPPTPPVARARPDARLLRPQGDPARALRRLASGRGQQWPLRGTTVAGRGPNALPRALEALCAEGPGRGRLAHLQGGTPAPPGAGEGRSRPRPDCPGRVIHSVSLPRPGLWPAAGGLSAAAQVPGRPPRVRSELPGKPTSAARCIVRGAS